MMPSLVSVMGQEIFDLIYTHYDNNGDKITDRDDVLYCEENEIDKSRIESLKKLLTPITNAQESLIPLEAAKLLAAWGVEEAVDYFNYCINSRIDRLGNIEPHRLHGYDTTYEDITESLLLYHARCSDKLLDEEGVNKIRPLVSNILSLTEIIPYNMSYILPAIKNENWRVFESQLKGCFIHFLEKSEKRYNDVWNIIDLKLLFQKWDQEFLAVVELQYGVIEIPTTAQDRL
jgi:hypothetical protein